MSKRFNLVSDPWISVAGSDRVSLERVFSDQTLERLGGSAVQKIAVMKLLLAICQRAATPKTARDWELGSSDQMAQQSIEYLRTWSEKFWLFGPEPFLQFPQVSGARRIPIASLQPEVATGNTTVFFDSSIPADLPDYRIAQILVEQMSFALGGKKTDNSVVLSPDYSGKSNAKGNPSTSRPGPGVEYLGLLHSFVVQDRLIDTLWTNLMAEEELDEMGLFPAGVGTAPWEQMPSGENCATARAFVDTYIGRLVPLSRFLLIDGQSVHYTEGIQHLGYNDGKFDPSAAVDLSPPKPRATWVDPERRPWRALPALLSFLDERESSRVVCFQLKYAVRKARKLNTPFRVWSGGIRITSNAGEQYVTGTDDFVESDVALLPGLSGSNWFARLQREIDEIDTLSRNLYGSVMRYYTAMSADGKGAASQASNKFWARNERLAQELVSACGAVDSAPLVALRRQFAASVHDLFNSSCPRSTARGIECWARARPRLGKYLSMNGEDS